MQPRPQVKRPGWRSAPIYDVLPVYLLSRPEPSRKMKMMQGKTSRRSPTCRLTSTQLGQVDEQRNRERRRRVERRQARMVLLQTLKTLQQFSHWEQAVPCRKTKQISNHTKVIRLVIRSPTRSALWPLRLQAYPLLSTLKTGYSRSSARWKI